MLLRILQIALGLSFFLMAGLYLGRGFLPRVFTDDPAVIAIAGRVFPILAAFMVSTQLPYDRCVSGPYRCDQCWVTGHTPGQARRNISAVHRAGSDGIVGLHGRYCE